MNRDAVNPAESFTDVPGHQDPGQVGGQLMGPGLLTTDPWPVPWSTTCRLIGVGPAPDRVNEFALKTSGLSTKEIVTCNPSELSVQE